MTVHWAALLAALLLTACSPAPLDIVDSEEVKPDGPVVEAAPGVRVQLKAESSSEPIPTSSPTAPNAANPPKRQRWQGRLAKRVRTLPDAKASKLSYRRDAFGDDWADTDGNGCNQRDDVLLRDAVFESTATAVQGTCDHDVLSGTWDDPYTGRRLVFDDMKEPAQAMALQIDHVVSLAEAWRSGADRWTSQRRLRFANDLRYLLAVDGPANMTKSDLGPESWLPDSVFACTYVELWVDAKVKYGLGVDPAERVALLGLARSCS